MARCAKKYHQHSLHCGVITSKVTHDEAGVHVVMEEAGKERCGFVWVDLGLCCPVGVCCFDPLEVIIGEHCDGLS